MMSMWVVRFFLCLLNKTPNVDRQSKSTDSSETGVGVTLTNRILFDEMRFRWTDTETVICSPYWTLGHQRACVGRKRGWWFQNGGKGVIGEDMLNKSMSIMCWVRVWDRRWSMTAHRSSWVKCFFFLWYFALLYALVDLIQNDSDEERTSVSDIWLISGSLYMCGRIMI